MHNAMQNAMRIAVAVSLGTTWLAAPAVGQQQPSARLNLGTELRLTLRESGTVHEGAFARRVADSVVVRECRRCAPVAYPLTDLASLDRWQTHTSGGAVAGGAVLGMALGGLVAYGAAAAGSEHPCTGECGALNGVAAMMGGVVGLAVGSVVGYVHGQHGRWEPIRLPERR